MNGVTITAESICHEESKGLELDVRIRALRDQLEKHESIPFDPNYFQSRVSSAENKLHESIVRFNQTMADNRDLKDNIELLRKEKVTFESLHARLIKEVEGRNKEIADIIEKSNADYAAKDSVGEQITQLKLQAEKEHADFKEEWSELARLIENDKRMRDFVNQRELQKKRKEITRKQAVIPPSTSGIPMLNPADLDQMKERLSLLQSHFESIRLATGVGSIEELFIKFTDTEKVNFSLFNKTNMDMASLSLQEAKSANLKQELVHRRSLSISNGGSQGPIDQLGTIIENLDKKADEISAKYFMLNKLTSSLRAVVQSIFHKVFPHSECQKYMDPVVIAASMSTPLGTVTENNLVEYLAAVEAKVDELYPLSPDDSPTKLSLKRESKFSSSRKSISPIGVTSKSAGLPGATQSAVMHQMMHFRLPSAVEDDENEEARRVGRSEDQEALRPLTRNELRAKTLENMQRNLERVKNKKVRA